MPVLHQRIYFRQVLGLPAVGSTKQQVEEGAALVAAEAFAPQKSLLIVRQAGQRKEGELDSGLENASSGTTTDCFPSTHKQRQCFLETSSILFLRSSQGSVKTMEPGSAMGRRYLHSNSLGKSSCGRDSLFKKSENGSSFFATCPCWPAEKCPHLHDDPDGLPVAVKQGRRGCSWQLSQRGHAEQDGAHHQSAVRTGVRGQTRR